MQEKEKKQADWVKRVNSVLQTLRKNAEQQDNGFENSDFVKHKTRNSINETEFIKGLWDDGKSTVNSDSAEYVENSGLKLLDNVDESGIIEETVDSKYDDFDIDLLPEQIHHFATNKNLRYTPQFNKIVSKYGLDLNGDWNKQLMRHRGRHPNEYHKYILNRMQIIDKNVGGNVDLFIQEFNKLKKEISNNPYMLRKAFWKGRKNEILLDDL